MDLTVCLSRSAVHLAVCPPSSAVDLAVCPSRSAVDLAIFKKIELIICNLIGHDDYLARWGRYYHILLGYVVAYIGAEN